MKIKRINEMNNASREDEVMSAHNATKDVMYAAGHIIYGLIMANPNLEAGDLFLSQISRYLLSKFYIDYRENNDSIPPAEDFEKIIDFMERNFQRNKNEIMDFIAKFYVFYDFGERGNWDKYKKLGYGELMKKLTNTYPNIKEIIMNLESRYTKPKFN